MFLIDSPDKTDESGDDIADLILKYGYTKPEKKTICKSCKQEFKNSMLKGGVCIDCVLKDLSDFKSEPIQSIKESEKVPQIEDKAPQIEDEEPSAAGILENSNFKALQNRLGLGVVSVRHVPYDDTIFKFLTPERVRKGEGEIIFSKVRDYIKKVHKWDLELNELTDEIKLFCEKYGFKYEVIDISKAKGYRIIQDFKVKILE